MASHRVEQPGLSDSVHHHHHLPYSLNTNFMNQERSSSSAGGGGGGFNFGELEEAISLQHQQGHHVQYHHQQIHHNHDETKQLNNNSQNRTVTTAAAAGATLEMFPSWPMRFQQQDNNTQRVSSSKSGGEDSADDTFSSGSLEAAEIGQKRRVPPPQVEVMASGSGTANTAATAGANQALPASKPNQEKRRGPGSNTDKVLDAKTLRRLAQNREAAKKSRQRKKVYVQQLESSRIRLAQLEQELQRARAQGLFLGGGGVASANISTGGAMFDMDYGRWLDDDHRHMTELRTGLQAHLPDCDMRVIVDGCIAHYDELFNIKAVAAKSDVFHLITGMWVTPAERCFLWMGGFRPSDLIKMLISQLDPLTEQQIVGIYSLQQSTQQAEEALSQGLEQLQQSLTDTVANGSVNDSMHQMAVALGKLSNLEGFVRQADNLRQQTLHQLHRILTVRQAARCFLVIGEYYGRLRALSSLWASRPRETLMNDDNSCQTTTNLHLVQPSHSQFSNF